jgi:hypothetical protein
VIAAATALLSSPTHVNRQRPTALVNIPWRSLLEVSCCRLAKSRLAHRSIRHPAYHVVRIRCRLVAPEVEEPGLPHDKGSAVKVELGDPTKHVMLEGKDDGLYGIRSGLTTAHFIRVMVPGGNEKLRGGAYRKCVVPAKVTPSNLMLQQPERSCDFASQDLVFACLCGVHYSGPNVRHVCRLVVEQESRAHVEGVHARRVHDHARARVLKGKVPHPAWYQVDLAINQFGTMPAAPWSVGDMAWFGFTLTAGNTIPSPPRHPDWSSPTRTTACIQRPSRRKPNRTYTVRGSRDRTSGAVPLDPKALASVQGSQG